MTPENIHLNSFMYEPIVDMSDEHLRKLCREVVALKGHVRPANQCANLHGMMTPGGARS